jgi:Mn2+/Fe2+ NRAMP family transporter
MFLCVVGSALGFWPGTGQVLRGFLPSIPGGSGPLILAVLGGVGGTVTLLSYGYWVEERGWKGAEGVRRLRIDCAVGYALTGVFGVAMMVLAAGTVRLGGMEVTTRTKAAEVLAALGESIGEGPLLGLFLVGFWAAVFSSLVGVAQGVPYLFADYLYTGRVGDTAGDGSPPSYTDLTSYKLYQAGMLLAGGMLLFTGRPAVLMMVYALFGSLFMPFLGVTLLWMGNLREPLGRFRNGWPANLVLGASVLFFALLFIRTVLAQFG